MTPRRTTLIGIFILIAVSLACNFSGSSKLSPTSTRSRRATQDNQAAQENRPAEAAPTQVDATQPPEPAALPYRLALVSLDVQPPSGGWQLYTAQFALENISDSWQPVTVDSGPGTVETQEGYTYDVDAVRYDRMAPILYGDPLTIPGGFRIRGSSDDYNGFDNVLSVSFRAAEDTHPTRILFQNYGAVDLGSVQAPLFPTDQPPSSFANFGDTLEIPGKARLTFVQPRLSEYGIYAGVTVDIRFENLSAGYETALNAGCFLIDGWGYIRWNKEDMRFAAGPGQTTETRLGFYLWNPGRAYRGSWDITTGELDQLLSNSKIICRGDFEVVLNLQSAPLAAQIPTAAPEPTLAAATEAPVGDPGPAATETVRLPGFLYDSAIIQLHSLGSIEGPRWLDGEARDGTLGLADYPQEVAGTHWMVTALGGDVIALEHLGSTGGLRWLDGHTRDGTLGLAPDREGYSGTRWRVYAVADNTIALECLGDVDGPRWLDGRSQDGTVGLLPQADSTSSGTLWQVYPGIAPVQGIMPDPSTDAYAVAEASGWQAAAQDLLATMNTQVTFNTNAGLADQVTSDDDQMIKSIFGERERIEVKPDHCSVWWSWGGEWTGPRFSAQQDWQLLQGPGNAQEGYGMMVRADGTAHYQLGIRDNEQQFDLEYWLSGAPQVLQDWTYSDAIRRGDVNRLGVVADGGHFYFLVNGIVVAELYDERTPDGPMGSYFNTCDPADATIFETDNFELRK